MPSRNRGGSETESGGREIRLYGYYKCDSLSKKGGACRKWQSSYTWGVPNGFDDDGGRIYEATYGQDCGKCKKKELFPYRIEPLNCSVCGKPTCKPDKVTTEVCVCRPRRPKNCSLCNQVPKNCVCCKRCVNRRRQCKCCEHCHNLKDDCQCTFDAETRELLEIGPLAPPISEDEEDVADRKEDSGRPHLTFYCGRCKAGKFCVRYRLSPDDRKKTNKGNKAEE